MEESALVGLRLEGKDLIFSDLTLYSLGSFLICLYVYRMFGIGKSVPIEYTGSYITLVEVFSAHFYRKIDAISRLNRVM